MNIERIVLRAELSHHQREIVAHTTELTRDSIVVRTDEPLAVGDTVQLRLSLRQLLAPLQLVARVAAHEPGAGLGYFPGVTLALDDITPQQQAHLSWLLGGSNGAELGSGPDLGGELPACRILVVEDSAIMREFVELGADRFADRRVKVAVDTADSAERALALLETRQYAIALIDLYLPGQLNGDDLVRMLRERDVDVAVIGFSIGGAAARAAFLDAGADLYLDKPVMVKDLFATVQRLTLLNARKGLV